MSGNESLLFLNSPIRKADEDIIGMDVHVRRISDAIDKNADMIAISSPFGSGKTSIVELLEAKRREKIYPRFGRVIKTAKKFLKIFMVPVEKEEFIRISMWTQLEGVDDHSDTGNTTNLHRSFVYQLAKHIHPSKGTYVNRRLSKNYGLLRIHTNKLRYWLLFVAVALCAFFCWAINNYADAIDKMFPLLSGHRELVSAVLLLISIAMGAYVLAKADIVFSTKQSEGVREIEADEVVDLYRTEILGQWIHRYWPPVWLRKIHQKLFSTRYVVSIEDLDRTTDPAAVLNFLRELRKYYVPECHNDEYYEKYRNRIVFIVSIKPEQLMESKPKSESASCDVASANRKESLYAKLFDLVLNLYTINVDDFGVILSDLLQPHEEKLRKLGIKKDGQDVMDVPGMQWIIHGEDIGIREIKERLNIAFSLYESIEKKFSKEDVDFAKCAVTAYLSTAFEREFFSVEGSAYQELIDCYMASPNADYRSGFENMKGTSEEYAKQVWELIDAKLIDTTYRTYFYNHPKNGIQYSADELTVVNAILYNTDPSKLYTSFASVVERVDKDNPGVIIDAYKRRQNLKLLLPDIVLHHEPLFLLAFQNINAALMEKINEIDKVAAAGEGALKLYRKILSFDIDHIMLDKTWAESLAAIWEKKYQDREAFLRVRLLVCQALPTIITWYKDMFIGGHPLLTIDEISCLKLSSVLSLLNYDVIEFPLNTLKLIQSKVAEEYPLSPDMTSAMWDHYRKASSLFREEELVPVVLDYMVLINQIDDEFEKMVMQVIQTEREEDEDATFTKYQELINQKAGTELSVNTAEHICTLAEYSGYNSSVASELYRHGHTKEYLMLTLEQNGGIDFSDLIVLQTIKDERDWLLSEYRSSFVKLRQMIIDVYPSVEQYSFMFDSECPVMTPEEFSSLFSNDDDQTQSIFNLIPPGLMTETLADLVVQYFNRKKRQESYRILMYLSDFPESLAAGSFEKLDFSMIRYKYIAKEKRSNVKLAFHGILNLDDAESQLKFMRKTQLLDDTWEKEYQRSKTDDTIFQKQYVDLINELEKASAETINTLMAFNNAYGLKSCFTDELFNKGKYVQYVMSKVLWENKFAIEEGNRGLLLWDAYVSTFKDTDGVRSKVQGIMGKNTEFLQMLVDKDEYKDTTEECFEYFSALKQNKGLLRYAYSLGSTYAIEYYGKIADFADDDAAKDFIEIMKESAEIAADKFVYLHAYDLLSSKTLRSNYTRLYKKLNVFFVLE